MLSVHGNPLVDNVQLRFIAKAFSHEMILLWNELAKMKERIIDAPYLVPPSLLAAPVASQIRCRLLYGPELKEFDSEDTFVADNGMSFTLYKHQKDEDGAVILENVEHIRMRCFVSHRCPVFSIELPTGKELLWIKASGVKLKRVYGGDNDLKVEGVMYELINRLSFLPVIKEGIDNDILSPHCERIIDELAFLGKRMGKDGALNKKRVFFTVDFKCFNAENRECVNFLEHGVEDDGCTIAVEYALCSMGRLESGTVLKCCGGNSTVNAAMEVLDTVYCSYDEADFGAAFRYAASWRRIWSLSDIRDSSLTLFPHILKDVDAVKGSFVKHGAGAVSGIIVTLYMKDTIGNRERFFWRTKVEEFLIANSPSTYNYMVITE